MPRRKRPTPPPPGSLPLRSLAPRPDSTTSTRGRSIQTSSSQSRSTSEISSIESDRDASSCGVPQCKLENCNLATHLHYGCQRRLALLRGDLETRTLQAMSTMAATEQLQSPQLPLDDTPDNDFQRLLHEFWSNHYDRMVLVYQPQRLNPVVKSRLQRLASQNVTYCLTLVALSHIANIKDRSKSVSVADTELTDLIYSHLVQITREKIDRFDVAETDVLLLAIMALCTYEMMLDRHEALGTHQIGITALVSSHGGVHNLGLSLPYVLALDKLLAVRTNQTPQFTRSEAADAIVTTNQLLANNPTGVAFQSASGASLSEPIATLCYDAAQLLVVMDEFRINFDPARQSEVSGSKFDYFRFLRESLDYRHAVLNHQCCDSDDGAERKDLLALTAMKIVTYYLTMDNYLPFLTDSWAGRLWNALSTATPRGKESLSGQGIRISEWVDEMPLLLWLLFACALPGARTCDLSFAARLGDEANTGGKTNTTKPQPNQPSIMSPSSPVRHRYLPQLILQVAEYLVGERPLSGTEEWDEEVTDILGEFIWNSERLGPEFRRIIGKVHENVLIRAESEA